MLEVRRRDGEFREAWLGREEEEEEEAQACQR